MFDAVPVDRGVALTGRIGGLPVLPRGTRHVNPLYRGANQTGLRAANERLVLSLIRLHGQLSKGQIADITGLTAQTASVIVRSLEADGLLRRGLPVRGKIGQPSVPMSLDPAGAMFLGLHVRAGEAAIVLVDFLGQPQAEWRGPIPRRRRDGASEAVLDAMRAMVSGLDAGQAARLQGLGIAMSAPMLAEIGEPGLDALAADVEERLRLPAYIQDEAVAACSAELVHGLGSGLSDVLFLHVGEAVGGAFVRNGRLQFAASPASPDIGRMFVPTAEGRLVRLADVPVPRDPATPTAEEAATLARAVGCAIQAVASTMMLDAVILNGTLSAAARRDVVHRVRTQLRTLDPAQPWPNLQEGMPKPVSLALGAACIPLLSRFSTETGPARH